MAVGVRRVWGGSITLLAALILVLTASSGRATASEDGAREERASQAHLREDFAATNKTQGECEFGGQWFGNGDAVPTKEPCLVCTCNVSLVCHLRVCPTVPNTTPSGCYKVKTAGQCCPEVVCDGELDSNRLYRNDGVNRVTDVVLEYDDEHQRHREAAAEQAAAAAAEAAVIGTRRRGGIPDATNTSSVMGCVSDGAVFAEGSAMMSHDECSYCFCIRGQRQCVAPKCVLPLEGCRPRYRTFSCCPNFYDCHGDAAFQSATTTTTEPPSTTCMVDGVEYTDGLRVEAAESNTCESCFCLRGHVSCSNHTCDDPPDAEGCTPIYYEGSCCPTGYTCGDPSDLNRLQYQRESRQGFGDNEESSPANTENNETTGTGHVGEVFFVQDRKRLTPFAPFSTTPPPWQRPVEVGVGVNVKGNLDDATAFGPILIYDNRVRRDRQQKAKNTTELPTEEEKATDVTDAPFEETTILPEEDMAEEIVLSDSIAASSSNEPLYFEKENEEVKVTTMLSPVEPLETTIAPQTKTTTPVTQSTPTSPVEPAESLLPTTEDVPDSAAAEKPEETVDIEYLDLDTHIPTYDITVGSSVMTAGHSHHSPVGVGQVIPVSLEPEDLMPHSRPSSRPDSQIIIIKKPDHKETEPEEPIIVTEATESQDQGVSERETEKLPVETVTPVVDEAPEPEHKQEEGNEEFTMEHKTATEGEVLEAEHKTPETESASEAPRPSILSALFNILTQTERPRPDPTRTSRPNPDSPTPEQSDPNESRPTRFRPDRPLPPRFRPEQPGGQRPFRPRPERPGILRPRPDIIRNDRPRPERLPPPSRLPFRPRPRPSGRPDFVPPRFRFTTPAPSPDTPTEEETTAEPSSPTSVSPAEEESSSSTPGLPFRFTPPTTESAPRLPPNFTPPTTESAPRLPPKFTPSTTESIPRLPPRFTTSTTESEPRLPSQFTPSTTESTDQVLPLFGQPTTEIPARVPPPQFVRPTPEGPALAPFIPPFLQPTPAEPRPGVANPNPNPIPLFILPDPIHTRPTLHPFIPPPAISSAQPASVSLQGLPSQPVLESGFQGMRKESEGVTPNIDIPEDYDTQGEPTLPPSLPNLKIIPFVAADALTGPDRPFSREDPRSTPRPQLLPILPLKDDHNADTGEVSTDSPPTTPTTTPATTRRPPIIPARRPPPRPASGDATRRPFLPFARPGERSTRPPFKPKPTPASREDQTTADSNPTLSTRPDILLAFRDRPSSRPPFIPPRRTTFTESTTTRRPTTTPSTAPPPRPPPPQPSTPFRPKSTTILPVQTSRPIDSNDISNLLLQDVFQLPPGQSFSVSQGTPKPSRPVKVAAALPEIPAAVRDQLPLATDPVLASGLLKLSGCNIYGRMYVVKDRIPELSAKCKECRCTPVGVQCLPIC